MSLNSKRLSQADVRLKIFTEVEADLEAQFLELMTLRERVRKAEQRMRESPRQLSSPQLTQRVPPAPASSADRRRRLKVG
jgi:hypothetical protein